MKKFVWLFSVLLLVVAAGLLYGQGPAPEEPQYVMVQWTADSQILVFKGPGIGLETVKCKGAYSQNCVLELLGRYKSKGYRLLTATATASPDHSGQVIGLEK